MWIALAIACVGFAAIKALWLACEPIVGKIVGDPKEHEPRARRLFWLWLKSRSAQFWCVCALAFSLGVLTAMAGCSPCAGTPARAWRPASITIPPEVKAECVVAADPLQRMRGAR